MFYLKQLLEAQRKVRAEMRTLTDRNLSPAEDARFKELDVEDKRLVDEIIAEEKREQRRAEIEERYNDGRAVGVPGEDRGPSTGRPGGRPETREARGRIEHLHARGLIGDAPAARAVALIEQDRSGVTANMFAVLADPDYSAAFARMLVDPQNGHRNFTARELDAYQRAEVLRSMQVGLGTSGGLMVPTHLDPSIVLSNDGAINPLREISRVVTLTLGNEWHGVTSGGVDAAYAAELTEVGDDSPTLAGPSIPVHRAHAFVQASFEAFEDIKGLGQEVVRMFGDARDRLEANKFTVGLGSGSDEPEGFLETLENDTTTHVEVTTQGAFSSDDVYKLTEALAPRWRARARFASDVTVLNSIEQFETGNGAKQFPSVPDGVLVRRPIHEVSDMPPLLQQTTTVDPLLVLGDFQQFLIVDKLGAVVSFVPHIFGTGANRPVGASGWYLMFRSSSKVILPNAFRLLVDQQT